MHVVETIIAVTWVAFWIYWLTASVGAKPARTRAPGFIGMRVAIIILVLGLLRAGVFKGHQTVVGNPWLQGVGLAIVALGLALAVWARVFLGRNWGMPMSQKADPELVTNGPYRGVRHPIYSGILVAMVGTAVAVSVYWLTAVVLLGGYFVYSATVEERNMARVFPGAYPAYKRSTTMLIPFVF